MKAYLEKITPSVSDAWRADELYFKVPSNPKYLYVLMYDWVGFWISQQVADTKYTSNVTPCFVIINGIDLLERYDLNKDLDMKDHTYLVSPQFIEEKVKKSIILVSSRI